MADIDGISSELDSKTLDRLIAQVPGQLRDVVQKAAHDIEGSAKIIVPVDTGATKNSIFVEPRDGGFAARIGPTTHYAPFLELGTHKMAARPFMVPSLERHRRPFTEAVEVLIKRMASG